MSKYGLFSAPYFPVFGLNSISPYSVRMRQKTDQKKLRIWTHFTRCSWSTSQKLLWFQNSESESLDFKIFTVSILADKLLEYTCHRKLWFFFEIPFGLTKQWYCLCYNLWKRRFQFWGARIDILIDIVLTGRNDHLNPPWKN